MRRRKRLFCGILIYIFWYYKRIGDKCLLCEENGSRSEALKKGFSSEVAKGLGAFRVGPEFVR